MENKLKHITDRLIGNPDQFEMKSRIFNMATMCIGFAALIDALVEFYIGLSPKVYLFGFLVAAFTAIFYTYNRLYQKYQIMVWPLMILGYVIVGYHWYFSGGFLGTAPLLALGFIAVMPVLMEKKQLYIALSIMILFALLIFFIELYQPQLVSYYSEKSLQMQDIVTTLILLSIVLVIAISIVVQGYQKAHEKITKMNKLLHETNMKVKKKNRELAKALDDIDELSGLVPICSNCKKIRDDKGYWNQIESYIEQRSGATFSHGICPECIDKLYGNEDWYIKKKLQK